MTNLRTGGGGRGVLHCAVKNFTGKLAGEDELRTNSVRSWEQCCVFYLICFCNKFLYQCNALTNWASELAESWWLIIVRKYIPGNDEDNMMSIWISYNWIAALKKTNDENIIIAVKDATLRKESLKNLGLPGFDWSLLFFVKWNRETLATITFGRLHPPLTGIFYVISPS